MMTVIFSVNEIKTLYEKFSIKHTKKQSQLLEDSGKFLVPNSKQDGFVTLSSLFNELQALIHKGSEIFNVETIAQRLGVEEETVREVIFNSDRVIVNHEKNGILTRTELLQVLASLRLQLDSGPVEIESFCKTAKVSAATLITLLEGQAGPLSQFYEVAAETESKFLTSDISTRLLCSHAYWNRCIATVTNAFSKAWDWEEPIEIHASRLGIDDSKILAQLTNDVLCGNVHLQGNVEVSGRKIKFTPRSWHESELKRKIGEFGRADSTFLDLNDIEKYADGMGISRDDVKTMYIEGVANYAIQHNRFLVSKAWIELLSASAKAQIDTRKFSITKVDDGLPSEVVSEIILPVIEENLKSNGADTVRFEAVIFDTAYVLELRNRLCESAANQASEAWKEIQSSSSQPLRLSQATLLETFTLSLGAEEKEIAAQHGTLTNIYKSHEAAIEESYTSKLDTLQESAETEFCARWTSQVMSTHALYKAGIEHCSDLKLRDQLYSLLNDHMMTDLIPKFLDLARSDGLTRNKKLKRFAEKTVSSFTELRAANKSSSEKFQDLSDRLSRCQKQLAVAEPDELSIQRKKEVMKGDLIKSMRKDKNAPRVFLSLVLVLWAQRMEGLLYASGKFAPKILKVLKNAIPESTWNRLETLKDSVKSGAVTPEQINEMREIALE